MVASSGFVALLERISRADRTAARSNGFVSSEKINLQDAAGRSGLSKTAPRFVSFGTST